VAGKLFDVKIHKYSICMKDTGKINVGCVYFLAELLGCQNVRKT
jgi:hypothetical protein